MSFAQGAGFRMCGAVVRRFVPPSGKCAFLTLGVPGARGEVKHDLRTFDEALIIEVGALGQGQIVEVTGGVDNEPLTDKARNKVQVDGRPVFCTKLTIKALKVEGASKRSASTTNDTPPEDDEKHYGF